MNRAAPTDPPEPTFADVPASRLPRWLDRLDQRISHTLDKYGVRVMRYALAFVFVFFGILKPLGVSPAEPLLRATIDWVPLVSTTFMLHAIGWWEVAIGVCFLVRPLMRLAVLLLAGQMVGTFLPLVIVPGATWQGGDAARSWAWWAPTTEGQYILKNLLIIAGAMVVGGTARHRAHDPERDRLL